MEKEFNYSYTAPTEEERKDVERIRNEYAQTQQSNAVQRLKKLDDKVKKTPTIIALIVGIVGTLIFGTGMALALEFSEFGWGIATSVIGCVVIACAHLVYSVVFKKMKAKYSQEILQLSEKILNEEN